MKQAYEKAKAKVVLFDNSDVITTSGETEVNGGCKNKQPDRTKDCVANLGNQRGNNCSPGSSGLEEDKHYWK